MFTDEEYQCDSETASHSNFQAVLKPVQHTVSLDAHSIDKQKTVENKFLSTTTTLILNNHMQKNTHTFFQGQ